MKQWPANWKFVGLRPFTFGQFELFSDFIIFFQRFFVKPTKKSILLQIFIKKSPKIANNCQKYLFATQ